MNRKLILVLLFLVIFPTLASAQITAPSEQMDGNSNERNVVSLTTTDLLNSQDFAPKVTELPAKRSRTVNSARKSKTENGVSVTPISTANVVTQVKQELAKLYDSGADLMKPSTQATESSEPNATVLPVVKNNGFVDQLISDAARRNGIDEKLIYAVMRQESSFNPRAVSYKGARGLMQLMPGTATRFGVRDIFDPAQNIEGGARYLRFLLNTFNGDVELALAGYNAGEGAVMRYGNRIPPYAETQDYVRKISAHYQRLTNGSYVQRNTSTFVSTDTKKSFSVEPLMVGTTMTQY